MLITSRIGFGTNVSECGQVTRKNHRKEQPPPVTKTKIEAQEFSGDFRSGSLLILTTPDSDFPHSTNEPGAVSAIWQVSDKPFSADPR
jgi:hypothetical protein